MQRFYQPRTHFPPSCAVNEIIRHQVGNAIALGLMSISAPLARARHALRSTSTRRTLMFAHAAINTFAVALMIYAALVAYSTKESYGKPHLTSTHSWFGGASSESRAA